MMFPIVCAQCKKPVKVPYYTLEKTDARKICESCMQSIDKGFKKNFCSKKCVVRFLNTKK